MTAIQDSKEIYINETERKPNLYAADVLAGVVAVITIVCIFNELGIFEIDKLIVRFCLGISFSQFVLMRFIVSKKIWIVHPASKYVIMSMVLFLVMTLTILLNIHAVLGFVLPLLVATQYRSYRVSLLALIGSCVCCAVAPILSYLMNTWSLNFMTGYIETFCHVTIYAANGNDISTASALWQITLYWSLPQVLTVGAFGVILFSVTRSSIDGVKNQIQVADLSKDLNHHLESVTLMQKKVLFALSDLVEIRDIESGGHVRRASEIVRLLVTAMHNDPECTLTDAFCSNVIKAAPMHDLGKIAIPDSILHKPERLSDEEYEIIKQHPIKSEEIIVQALTGIDDDGLLEVARNMARCHHERLDGSGYPNHLRGDEIPFEARIMAVADDYDSLISRRCLKGLMTFDEAFDVIESAMSTQFDERINPYLLSCRGEIEKLYTNQ